jgi:hypothetical protein
MTMFEVPHEIEETKSSKVWIAIVVVVLVIVLAVGYYTLNKNAAKQKAAAAAAAKEAVEKADPVKDLKIQRATMQKDSMGTTAVWLVTLDNQSETLTYSDITYQTDYIGADNNLIVENKGTIKATIGPHAENSSEIRDTAYPAGTAWFKFKVTGAKAKVE